MQLTVTAVEDRLAKATGQGSTIAVLGRRDGLLVHREQRHRVSRRHAEILLLLEAHPEGLSAEQLAVLLDERTLDPVTVRVEMARLRRTVGADLVGSRPYRLLRPLRSDVTVIRELLARGRTNEAIKRYAGPVLPRSSAPGVAELREEVGAQLRAAALLDGQADTLLAFAETEHGAADVEIWQTARLALPGDSPRLPFVLGRLDALARRDRFLAPAALLPRPRPALP